MYEIPTPVKIAIALHIIIAIVSFISIFSYRKFNISIKKVSYLVDPFFNLKKVTKNNVDYILGWLPIGSYVGPNEFKSDLENRLATEKNLLLNINLYNITYIFLAFLATVFLIHQGPKGLQDIWDFNLQCLQLLQGKITANEMVSRLHQKGLWNDFRFIFGLAFFYIHFGYLSQLGGEIKKIGWLLQLLVVAACIAIAYVDYRVFMVHFSLLDILYFYGASILSGAVLLFVSYLIIRKFNLDS